MRDLSWDSICEIRRRLERERNDRIDRAIAAYRADLGRQRDLERQIREVSTPVGLYTLCREWFTHQHADMMIGKREDPPAVWVFVCDRQPKSDEPMHQTGANLRFAVRIEEDGCLSWMSYWRGELVDEVPADQSASWLEGKIAEESVRRP